MSLAIKVGKPATFLMVGKTPLLRARKPLVIPCPCYLVFDTLLKVYKGDSTKRFDTPLQLNFTTRHVFLIERRARFTLHFMALLRICSAIYAS